MPHELLCRDVKSIRQSKPIIHNLTNLVVMQQTANALLALGSSPIMAHAEEEISDIVSLANAVVINMGTLDNAWVQRAMLTLQEALNYKKPVVFDPVGVGASQFRNQISKKILMTQAVSLMRANASEILALVGDDINSSGVDSQHQSHAAVIAAKQLAKQYQCVVVISGATDYIISETGDISSVDNGVAMQQMITGMGCTATAIIGAFLAVNVDIHAAAVHAMTMIGLAAEQAAEKSPGPGSLAMHFFDALYTFRVPAHAH